MDWGDKIASWILIPMSVLLMVFLLVFLCVHLISNPDPFFCPSAPEEVQWKIITVDDHEYILFYDNQGFKQVELR